MDKAQFWQLIEASRAELSGADICDQQADNLKALLLELSADEIVQFDEIFDQLEAAAYRWDLWAAAYIINDGASDDGFAYFCWWLIAQGRDYYETALKDVEKAGDNAIAGDSECAECEDVRYCVGDAYREKTGNDLPIIEGNYDFDRKPVGEMWQEEELPKLYPRLCEKFG